MHNRNTFRYKSIRDPLYGFIDLTKMETEIIDTSIFRRLQFIKQLSHAYVAYPSAIHTRFEHSLGVLHIANRMCSELYCSDEHRIIVRLAALLHDIGHGPFSHLFEEVIKLINPKIKEHHEFISKIIIDEDPEINSIIEDKKSDIIKLLYEKERKNLKSTDDFILSDIISSGVDADKLDYLRRDSYHIGVAYGQFDLDRILHTIRKTPAKKTKICIDIKGKDALENYRIGRYLMHAQVYKHHTRIIADQMFLKALDVAMNEEYIIDKKNLTINETTSNTVFLNFYKTLDDNSIYDMIINNQKSNISKRILLDIKKRKLLKRICEFTPKDLENYSDVSDDLIKMDEERRKEIASDVAKSLHLLPHQIIFHKSKNDIKLYKEREIFLLDNNNVRDLINDSPITAKDKTVIKYYVFGPQENKKEIITKVSEQLKLPAKVIERVSVL